MPMNQAPNNPPIRFAVEISHIPMQPGRLFSSSLLSSGRVWLWPFSLPMLGVERDGGGDTTGEADIGGCSGGGWESISISSLVRMW